MKDCAHHFWVLNRQKVLCCRSFSISRDVFISTKWPSVDKFIFSAFLFCDSLHSFNWYPSISAPKRIEFEPNLDLNMTQNSSLSLTPAWCDSSGSDVIWNTCSFEHTDFWCNFYFYFTGRVTTVTSSLNQRGQFKEALKKNNYLTLILNLLG